MCCLDKLLSRALKMLLIELCMTINFYFLLLMGDAVTGERFIHCRYTTNVL